jgi:hypothetical protein
MQLNFKQLDDSQKSVQFLNGLYSIERDRNSKWMWTKKSFSGIVNNIDYITISILSDIENVLTFDGYNMNITKECLNVVKLKTTGKSIFEVTLKDSFKPDMDIRDLGVKIVSIGVDGEIIF